MLFPKTLHQMSWRRRRGCCCGIVSYWRRSRKSGSVYRRNIDSRTEHVAQISVLANCGRSTGGPALARPLARRRSKSTCGVPRLFRFRCSLCAVKTLRGALLSGMLAIRGALFCGESATPSTASEPERLERWDRVVCVRSPVASKPGAGKLCSAFLVNAQERLFLVTAGHAAAETDRKSRLVYRDRTGKSQWVSLKVLFPAPSNPWHRDKTSDFAIAEVEPIENGQAYFSQLLELAIPLDSICTKAQPRTTRIDTAGFPLAIGAAEPVSAVAVVGHIASGEIQSDNDWGHEPIVYCTPALAQGTSGGPAFLSDPSHDAVTVVGMLDHMLRAADAPARPHR